MTQSPAASPSASLYERLGGAERLRALVAQIVDAHLENADIQSRFQPFDRERMVEGAFRFFAQAMGGPAQYAGRGLAETHRGMNVSELEFVAATDDVLGVLTRNGVGPQEQLEILGAFFAMKGEVLHR
jgi:hemoglobin